MAQLLKLIILLAAISVSACATRPTSLLIPTGQTLEGAAHVNVLTVSTRKKSDVLGQIYTGERGETPTMMSIDVAIPPSHSKGKVEWPQRHPAGNPASEFTTLSKTEIADEDLLPWFRKQQTNGRVIIFVHGFNAKYSDAVYRVAQISNDLDTAAAPVLFTWPSRGRFLSYLYDKESATYSRDALEEVLHEAVQTPEVKEVSIVAHSMGAWLTMEALRQSSIRNGSLNPKIKHVVLASPDIDSDVFAQQFATLGENRPQFTFVISKDDLALKLSRFIAGNTDRMGMVDLEDADYMAHFRETKGINVIDVSKLNTRSFIGHSKFSANESVIDLISELLTTVRLKGAKSEATDHKPMDTERNLLIKVTKNLEYTVEHIGN